jgi:hypothetical protein
VQKVEHVIGGIEFALRRGRWSLLHARLARAQGLSAKADVDRARLASAAIDLGGEALLAIAAEANQRGIHWTGDSCRE